MEGNDSSKMQVKYDCSRFKLYLHTFVIIKKDVTKMMLPFLVELNMKNSQSAFFYLFFYLFIYLFSVQKEEHFFSSQ